VDGLEVAVGDRVIARRNDRELDVDNGTRGTVEDVDYARLAVTIQTDSGELRELPADYVAEHVEHAYALTGHGSQGATVERAVVVGQPADFTNEWAYTALSRARDPVSVHLVAQAPDRTGRAEIAPDAPERTAEAVIDAMRAAMGRREREDLAIDQLDRQHTPRAAVPGEAAAEAIERDQRQQLALDLDPTPPVAEPVPEVLRALRPPEPLSIVNRTIGVDDQHRAAIARASATLRDLSGEELRARAERLDALLETYPVERAAAARRAQELERLRDDQTSAHEHIGAQQARLDQLGALSRLTARGRQERAFSETALSSWIERAEFLDDRVRALEPQVDADRHERAAWFAQRGEALVELAAARVELHDRDDRARERRIDAIRRDPPEWVTDRLGPRPDEPTARTSWDRAAAHLDDYRDAFGHPPGHEQPSRRDHRQRDAWEQAHEGAAKAIQLHPERPVVQRAPPQLHRDIGLDIGR
jgi:hypothetical protein